MVCMDCNVKHCILQSINFLYTHMECSNTTLTKKFALYRNNKCGHFVLPYMETKKVIIKLAQISISGTTHLACAASTVKLELL